LVVGATGDCACGCECRLHDSTGNFDYQMI
jgi:hypothetical protein